MTPTPQPAPTPPPAPAAPRFYHPNLPQPRLVEQRCALDSEQTRHARKVLRLQPGARIELFDGRGGLAPAILDAYEGGLAVCRATDLMVFEPARPTIAVASAVPKGSHADAMIDQLNQLGADRLIPLRTQRSVVDPRPTKLERFARNAIESAKQCGRLFLMAVQEPCDLGAVLTEQADVRLIAQPGAASVADLPARLRAAERVLVLIGPEGGWTDEELAAATEAGFVPWCIGPHVLRIETAAPSALAVLRYLAG